VLALLGGALFLLRKRGAAQFSSAAYVGAGRSPDGSAMERLSLGPQHTLHLIRSMAVRFWWRRALRASSCAM
jgi:hypothetical protein